MIYEILDTIRQIWRRANFLIRAILVVVFGWGVVMLYGAAGIDYLLTPGSRAAMSGKATLALVPVAAMLMLFFSLVLDPLWVVLFKLYKRTNGVVTFLFGVLSVYLFIGVGITLVPIGAYPLLVLPLILVIVTRIALIGAPSGPTFTFFRKACTVLLVSFAVVFFFGAMAPDMMAQAPKWFHDWQYEAAYGKPKSIPTIQASAAWERQVINADSPYYMLPVEGPIYITTVGPHDPAPYIMDQNGKIYGACDTPSGPQSCVIDQLSGTVFWIKSYHGGIVNIQLLGKK